MGPYEVEISRTAEKQLRKLPRDDQERVARRMLLLAEDPFPRGARNRKRTRVPGARWLASRTALGTTSRPALSMVVSMVMSMPFFVVSGKCHDASYL